MLEIAFDKKSLRQICENEAKANHKFGEIVAQKLKARLADMLAATCVDDLVAGHPHKLDGQPQHFVVGLCDGFYIVFCANHNTVPKLESGGVDWSKVSRIKLLKIESGDDGK